MRILRKLYLVCITAILLVPFGAFAQHHDHHKRPDGFISFFGNGWYVNIGNPHQYHQPPIYYQAPPVIYVQPKQQVLVCDPTIYYVQTPNGLIAQQKCWMEWR